jgi:iron complex transport system ATP-binding protein
MILELQNITAGYGGITALNNISCTIAPGKITGIIGPNGAGKTTLFRVITSTLRPRRGKIFFDGIDIHTIARMELAKQVAAMPQMLESSFPFSVEDFVAMGRFPHHSRFEGITALDKQVIEQALADTETTAFRERPMNELSGGERQRVMLAQALAQSPKLLLLDEPTAHLDIGHQVQMLELIRSLNREKGITIVTVLHDLTMSGEYCDDLLMLKDGAVHAQGTPAKVLTYQNIESVYNTVVVVKENPFSRKPYIIAVPKEFREKGNNNESR